jgi:hypothetical protein
MTNFCVMVDFTWRNINLFVVALAITSCLMAWAVITAVDRLLQADGDQVQPIKIERPAIVRVNQARSPKKATNKKPLKQRRTLLWTQR